MLAVAQTRYPKLSDYPVAVEWDAEGSKRVAAKHITPEQRRLQHRLKLVGRSPQFAGHYDALYFRCENGDPECRRLAFIDMKTGAVQGSPFANKESQFALPPSSWDWRQPDWMGDSRLLIVHNVCPEGPSSCGTFYFLWDDKTGFRLIQKKPVPAQPVIPDESPILGTWEGQWSYTTGGAVDPSGKFRMVFTKDLRKKSIAGTFQELDRKRKTFRMLDLVETRADKSSYRMNIDGNCWNVGLDEESADRLTGVWNGGPCSVIGIGGGARLISFEARRIEK